MKKNLILIFLYFSLSPLVYNQPNGEVRIWKDTLTIPTYQIHDPDVNPMFFRNQSYQGASRVIYPYPLMDNFSNIKQDKTYTALYIENRYIKLCVLQLGKGSKKQAGELFQNVIQLDAGHIWAKEFYEVMSYSIIILPLNISGPLLNKINSFGQSLLIKYKATLPEVGITSYYPARDIKNITIISFIIGI